MHETYYLLSTYKYIIYIKGGSVFPGKPHPKIFFGAFCPLGVLLGACPSPWALDGNWALSLRLSWASDSLISCFWAVAGGPHLVLFRGCAEWSRFVARVVPHTLGRELHMCSAYGAFNVGPCQPSLLCTFLIQFALIINWVFPLLFLFSSFFFLSSYPFFQA